MNKPKTYKYQNRSYKIESKKFGKWGIYFHHTFYDGDKEMFVLESLEFLNDGEVDIYIDRYILRMRKEKLLKLQKK